MCLCVCSPRSSDMHTQFSACHLAAHPSYQLPCVCEPAWRAPPLRRDAGESRSRHDGTACDGPAASQDGATLLLWWLPWKPACSKEKRTSFCEGRLAMRDKHWRDTGTALASSVSCMSTPSSRRCYKSAAPSSPGATQVRRSLPVADLGKKACVKGGSARQMLCEMKSSRRLSPQHTPDVNAKRHLPHTSGTMKQPALTAPTHSSRHWLGRCLPFKTAASCMAECHTRRASIRWALACRSPMRSRYTVISVCRNALCCH